MKLNITFKNPDSVTDSIREAANGNEDLIEELEDIACKWIKYGEYLTVEIDTETKSIRVLEA